MQEENLRLEDLLERIRVPDEKGVISKVAIIGAGVMGQGIAQTVAESGIDVLIIEHDDKCLDLAKNLFEYLMNKDIDPIEHALKSLKEEISKTY